MAHLLIENARVRHHFHSFLTLNPTKRVSAVLSPTATLFEIFLVPLAVLIIYYDVRYRRIPNPFVLATLVTGLILNIGLFGVNGVISSIGGCVLAFILMFMLHVFGAMGAGDVKLFAAIGSVVGAHLVIPTLIVVMLTGGLLALVSILRSGVFATTMHRVMQIFVGLLPGWEMPRFSIPTDRRLTIPYGAAITLGAIISTAIFHP
ncbi:MAG TPA: A24 family peptidase [Pyrinomonadaceae bacterium]